MNDTRTVFNRHIVTCDNTESAFSRIHPGDQLLVVHTGQFRTFPLAYNLKRNQFIARLVIGQCQTGSLRIEMCIQQIFRQHNRHRHTRVRIEGLNGHIREIRAHTKRRVRRQCPGSGRPCQEERFAELRHLRFRVEDAELRRASRVLHVAIATRLVQLVRAKARSGGRRIRLYGVSFIEQPFLIEFLQQVPQCFDISVIVCDIRVFHIHPVAHLLRQVLPLLRELHHVAAAGCVILGYRDLFADIFLGYPH